MTTATKTIEARPFLKWAGGKSSSMKTIAQYVPIEGIHTYFSPFLGGAADYFYLYNLEPGRVPWQHVVLSDINKDLITTYQMVQKQPEKLMERLDIYHECFINDEGDPEGDSNTNFFYKSLAKFEEEFSPDHESMYHYDGFRYVDYREDLTRAARFILLNKTCFNGIYRVNADGEFNVPCAFNHWAKWGQFKKSALYDRENILACSRSLHSVELKIGDFFDVVHGYTCPQRGMDGHMSVSDIRDFVYLDPPYFPVSKTANFTGYSADGFGAAEQVRLYQFTRDLEALGKSWAVSNSDTPFIRRLYGLNHGNKFIDVPVARSINSDPKKRGKVNELLILPKSLIYSME